MSGELRRLALAALDRVAGPESELAALWGDARDDGWTARVAELRARVGG